MRPPINSSVKGREKKWMKKVPSRAKGTGTFSFWDDFEAGEVFEWREMCSGKILFCRIVGCCLAHSA